MDFILFLLNVVIVIFTVYTQNAAGIVAMLSAGQVYVLGPGESLVLECHFSAVNYNLFDYPVLWRKTQHGEATQVNIMGNVNEPYMSSNRFEVAFSSGASRYQLELTIVDLCPEDSANYTCEVRGPHSVVLGQITHFVYVRSPISSLFLSDGNASEQALSRDSAPLLPRPTPPTTLHLVENRPATLRCTSFGGYPPPNLELYVGRRDVTSDFQFSNSARLTGARGARLITVRTDRWTHNYMPRDTDDGEKLKCIAVVTGLKAYTEFVLLSVDYSPKVSCTSAEAYLGEKNVHIACEVRAKPRPTSIFWIIDSNGTALSRGEVINEHWTLTEGSEGTNVTHVTLYIRHVTADSFRKYVLIVENSVAIATTDAELVHKKLKTTTKQQISDIGASSSSNSSASSPGLRSKNTASAHYSRDLGSRDTVSRDISEEKSRDGSEQTIRRSGSGHQPLFSRSGAVPAVLRQADSPCYVAMLQDYHTFLSRLVSRSYFLMSVDNRCVLTFLTALYIVLYRRSAFGCSAIIIGLT